MNLPGGMELVIIFLVILLVFGAKRIPEIAQGLGKGIREFKDATSDIKREMTTPAPPAPPADPAGRRPRRRSTSRRRPSPSPSSSPPQPMPPAAPAADPYATPDPYAPQS